MFPGVEPRVNYVIELDLGYGVIFDNYKKDMLKNLKKAENNSLVFSSGNYQRAISMYRELYKERFKHVCVSDYENLSSLCNAFEKKKQIFSRQVTGSNLEEILSIGLFFIDDKRIYNVMNSTTPNGRKKEANHFLLDQVIKEFAGKPLIFDFEGSDVPGIKSFYEKFGAINQPYYSLHFNLLPAPFKWLKT
jgi:hypothetical protein